ncbi:MAG: hypothetical protein IPL53_15375 [Ignavibacteria bacterium]|nr:hypothetical protein [Ignavibacteria bacterium]
MRFIVSFLLTAVVSYAAGFYFPWWSIAVAAFLIAVIIPQKPGITFLCAFFSLFFLWSGLSFFISRNNENILAHKLSLLIFNYDSPLILLILTGLTGGLVAGLAGLAGSYLRHRAN